MLKIIIRGILLTLFLAIFAVGGYLYLELNDLIVSENVIDNVADIDPNATEIPVTTNPITPATNPNSQTFADILSELNALRERRNLPPVQYDDRLHRAAAEQAAHTATLPNGRLSHTGAGGSTVADRVEAQSYSWATVAENLLFNYSLDGTEAYTLWRNSPPHFANMINPDVTEVGLAYTVTDIGQVYHAMVLARPR